MAWDNRTDVDALLKDHHRLMFGKGAAPMGRFFDRIEELWMNRIAGRIVETPVGPQAVPPSDYELWEKIYSPAELKKFDALFDEAAVHISAAVEGIARRHWFAVRSSSNNTNHGGNRPYYVIKVGITTFDRNDLSPRFAGRPQRAIPLQSHHDALVCDLNI